MATLPMFPLGSVLFPHAVLPLHVFEPRYRALTEHCLAGEREFGVVLIERGSEVGGGDVRFDVGTVARIVQAGQLDDGRWVLVTTGTERVRVREWLSDDPYPQADVVRVGDEATGDAAGLIPDVVSGLRRVLALRAELGGLLGEPLADPVGEAGVESGAGPGAGSGAAMDVTLDDDPVRASFEAAALASLGPLDAQALLELDDAGKRLARLATLLDDEAALLEFRLRGDD